MSNQVRMNPKLVFFMAVSETSVSIPVENEEAILKKLFRRYISKYFFGTRLWITLDVCDR